MQAARRLLGSGQEIVVYKNNTDGKGNSYGTHENYLVDRSVPFATLVRQLLPWFVSRQVFTGAGKVGGENGTGHTGYQLSQRADFFDEDVGLEALGSEEVGQQVLERWEAALTALERDPMTLDGQLDWVTKLNLLDAYRGRDSLGWDDPKMALLDLQYHDVRPEKSLFERLVRAGKVERLVEEPDVTTGMTQPPPSTRAYFRGQCLEEWADAVAAANWDTLILAVGSDPLP